MLKFQFEKWKLLSGTQYATDQIIMPSVSDWFKYLSTGLKVATTLEKDPNPHPQVELTYVWAKFNYMNPGYFTLMAIDLKP